MQNKFDEFRARVKNILVHDLHVAEVLTYPFVSEKLLTDAGQDPKNSYKIINSISPALQYYRQSLTPSLLEKVHLNSKVPYDRFALFELNQVQQKKYGLNGEEVPVSKDKIALALTDRKKNGSAYYEAKQVLEQLLTALNVEYKIVPLQAENATDAVFEKKRAAQILTTDGKNCLGTIGEYRKAVINNFKMPDYSAGFELNTDKVFGAYNENTVMHQKISTHSDIERDITFEINKKTPYANLKNAILQVISLQKMQINFDLTDIYQAEKSSTKKITMRFVMTNFEKTLTAKEINRIINIIEEKTQKLIKEEK